MTTRSSIAITGGLQLHTGNTTLQARLGTWIEYGQFMDESVWVGLGTLITAVIGLSLVGWQLHEQRRALRAEFGNLYIQRYWEIDDALLLEKKGSPLHTQHRHRYLRLFEDEFDVATLGFLDQRQWQAWHSVLDDGLALTRVVEDLEVCNPAADQFYRLRTCVQQRTTERRAHNVTKCLGAPLRPAFPAHSR